MKGKKEGQQFEKDFKNSIPKEVWYYRFKDGTSNWGGQDQSKTRFQHKNICDCELFYAPVLFLLELKSTKENRLAFSMIRKSQFEELLDAHYFNGIISGVIVNFREVEETYFIPIIAIKYYKENCDRKSIPISYFRDNCFLIEQEQLQVHYKYDIADFIKNIGKHERDKIGGIRKESPTDAYVTTSTSKDVQTEILFESKGT